MFSQRFGKEDVGGLDLEAGWLPCVRTFIIGMTGATLANLETMASAGGAPQHGPDFCGPGVGTCHYWSVGDGDPVAFVDALEQIQAVAVIPCEYAIPPAPPGEQLVNNLVDVTFTDANGNQSIIPMAADPGQCDPQGGGWYYDDPASPSTIRLCEATCNLVTAATAGASLDIVYGCDETVTIG